MTKVVLTNPASFVADASAVAQTVANNAAITAAIENTVSRDGTSPNSMSASFDMNSQRIINLAAPVGNNDAARLIDIGTAPASATAAAASAVAAAGSATAASGSATQALGYVAGLSGSSATSLLIATGSKSFTATTGKLWAAGQFIAATSNANSANYMHGTVTSYNSGTGALVINVLDTGGAGTFADWNLTVAGTAGPTGAPGSGTIAGSVNHGVGIATGATAMTSTAVMTDGQLLVGQSAADPLPKTITGDVTFNAAGASAIKSSVALTGNPTAAGSFSSGGSVSALGADANFALGGNRAIMDQAAGVIRIGAINGGGSAVSLTLYNNNVAAVVLNSAGTTWTFGALTSGNTFTFGGGGTTTLNVGVSGLSGGILTIAGSSSGFLQVLPPAAASGTCTLAPGTLTGSSTTAVWYDNIPQNSQSVAYQLVASDAQKHILHPSADTTARTWTIPANSTVAFPIGTAVTFVNQHSAGVITIAITTDTMRLAGAGTTGNRTLAADGIATAVKITSTEWIISGTGLS